MAKVTPKYIIGHWSAGNYQPCFQDMESYDLLINGDGLKILGNHHLDNRKASTAGMNSITYNISCCGGLRSTPLKKVQCEAFFMECAQALKRFNLTIDNFYTHAEIGRMCADGRIKKLLPYNRYLKNNIGKIDLSTMPYIYGKSTKEEFIKNKIQWYYEKL